MVFRMPWSRRHVSRRRRSARDIVCPYCFGTFPYWAMHFRYEPTPSSLEPERVYPMPGALRARLNPFYKMPRDMPVGPHGRRFHEKVCPFEECRRRTPLPLPYTAGVERSLILWLVGSKGAGLKTYRASLIRRLQEPESDFLVRPLNDYTLSDDRNEAQRLFADRMLLSSTVCGSAPWTYLVSPARGGKESFTLVLMHALGHSFEEPSYLSKLDGLVFMVDPLQLPSLAPLLGDKPKQSATIPLGIIINQLRRDLGLRDNRKKIPIPIAIVLTKADMLRDAGLIDRDSLWHLPVFHGGSYDLHLHHDVDAEFGGLFDRHEEGFLAAVANNFQDYAFFGVSATGCAAKDGKFPRVAPIRVEDPLLWLLYRLGAIEGTEPDG
jgi:hypothetical protein